MDECEGGPRVKRNTHTHTESKENKKERKRKRKKEKRKVLSVRLSDSHPVSHTKKYLQARFSDRS